MTEPSDIDVPLDPPDRDVAGRLGAERPVPAADFRGALGRSLVSADPGFGPRPERLRLTAALYLCGGMALIALGALQAAGTL